MLPQGVGTFSTPGRPASENFIFRLGRRFDPRPIFDLASPMEIPWHLAPSGVAHLVDGSSCLHLGQSGCLRSGAWTLETRFSNLVLDLGPRHQFHRHLVPILSAPQSRYSRTLILGGHTLNGLFCCRTFDQEAREGPGGQDLKPK